ncbi:MAG: radical SAM protein [bacterium]|nr:radical SAM protein [bacterium]
MKKAVFGTFEWAKYTENCIDGCKHDCKYCYSKAMAIRFKRKTSETWKHEKVRESSFNKCFNKREGTIMFPSSHDIHPEHLNENLEFLLKLLEPGNRVLIVTKPHLECIKKICSDCKDYKDRILFRFTIGSINSEILKFWEPGAPSFEERVQSLKFAYNRGFKTSISCEPLLDSTPEKLVSKLSEYVTDSIWIGKPNFILRRLRVNDELNKINLMEAEKLIEDLNDKNIKNIFFNLRKNKIVKWKESIKKVVGIQVSFEAGLDK